MFPPRQVIDRVWIGGISTATNEAFMRDHSIGLIINCTRHINAPFRHDIPTYRIPIDDSPEWQDLFRHHIRTAAGEIHKALKATRKSVLVHCHAGVSRSSTVVAAYLILYHGMTSDQAIAAIQKRKPETFQPYPVFINLLKELEAT
jgi:dual specificity phosphatase 12